MKKEINIVEYVGVKGFLRKSIVKEIFSRFEDDLEYTDIALKSIEIEDVKYDYFIYDTDVVDLNMLTLLFDFKVSQFMKKYNRMPTDYEMLKINIEIVFNYSNVKKECFDELEFELTYSKY